MTVSGTHFDFQTDDIHRDTDRRQCLVFRQVDWYLYIRSDAIYTTVLILYLYRRY